jgi:hypothetical protein
MFGNEYLKKAPGIQVHLRLIAPGNLPDKNMTDDTPTLINFST